MEETQEIADFIDALAKRVKTLRLQHQLTQLDLATKTDMDLRTIQRIEHGETNPPILNIYNIAQVFGMPIWELLDFSDTTTSGIDHND